jgi:hypothetical protein
VVEVTGIVGDRSPSRTASIARRSALLAVALALPAPATAYAHTGGRIATDFEARVAGLAPRAPGVRARVIGGDLKLELAVSGGHDVVVLGLEGEPFLRFTAAGVAANAASPTAWSTGVVARADAVKPAAGPVWRRVSSGHTYAWHENRLRPRPSVPGGGATPRRVAPWSIPLLVDGRRTRLGGWEWYASGPAPWPWLAALLVPLAAAIAAVRYGRRRLQRRLAAVLVPVAVGAWLVGWIGILVDGGASTLVVALAAAYAAVTILLVAAALAAATGDARMAVAGVVGALAAVFTLPEVEAFTRGFVLSALPATAARAAAIVSFTAGLALVAACIPAVADILRDDPLRRRLLAETPDDG